MPYANARVKCYDDGDIVLQSYSTDVVVIENGWMWCTGLYSATTRRHIGAFMKEYTVYDYHFAKMLYNTHQKYNVNTGEIASL